MKTTDLWVLNPDIPTENKWNFIRSYRNGLLFQSDWTQLSDAPIVADKKQEWITYRQILRDITITFTNPDDVVFPDEPV